MKKVYQTIVDKDKGNCMQAVVASLFEVDLNNVPDFLNFGDDWFWEFLYYFRDKGYKPSYIYKNKNYDLKDVAIFDGGVNGYFYASVPSATFDGLTHAVVVNMDLNVVHDPNPNGKALNIEPNDVKAIVATNDFLIGTNGEFIKGSRYKKPETLTFGV